MSDHAPVAQAERPDTEEVTRAERMRELLEHPEVTLVGVIIAFGALMTALNPVFLTPANLLDLLQATVIYFVVACGVTPVIVAGGFDFSIGSTFTLGGVSAAFLMAGGLPWPLAVVVGVALGAAVGYLNATINDRLSVPPIITTLGTFYFVAGVVVLFTGGRDISPLPFWFNVVGKGSLLGVPNLIWYGVIIAVAFHIALQHTTLGYNVRAVGGNRVAAVANGISAVRVNASVYVCAGAVAALGGILYAARTGSGQVGAGGASITLTAISAVLIGGTSLFGGRGTILGTALGTFLFATIDNGLAIASVPADFSNMIIGTVLVIAVAADSYRRRRSLLKFRQA